MAQCAQGYCNMWWWSVLDTWSYVRWVATWATPSLESGHLGFLYLLVKKIVSLPISSSNFAVMGSCCNKKCYVIQASVVRNFIKPSRFNLWKNSPYMASLIYFFPVKNMPSIMYSWLIYTHTRTYKNDTQNSQVMSFFVLLLLNAKILH